MEQISEWDDRPPVSCTSRRPPTTESTTTGRLISSHCNRTAGASRGSASASPLSSVLGARIRLPTTSPSTTADESVGRIRLQVFRRHGSSTAFGRRRPAFHGGRRRSRGAAVSPRQTGGTDETSTRAACRRLPPFLTRRAATWRVTCGGVRVKRRPTDCARPQSRRRNSGHVERP